MIHFKFIDDFSPETYNYLLGEDILVAPIHTNDTIRDPVKVCVGAGNKHDVLYILPGEIP